jgi:hypothetical protein
VFATSSRAESHGYLKIEVQNQPRLVINDIFYSTTVPRQGHTLEPSRTSTNISSVPSINLDYPYLFVCLANKDSALFCVACTNLHYVDSIIKMDVGILFLVYWLIMETLHGIANDMTKFLATLSNATGENKSVYIGTELQMKSANKAQNAVYEQMEGEVERAILVFVRRMGEIGVLDNVLEIRRACH